MCVMRLFKGFNVCTLYISCYLSNFKTWLGQLSICRICRMLELSQDKNSQIWSTINLVYSTIIYKIEYNIWQF